METIEEIAPFLVLFFCFIVALYFSRKISHVMIGYLSKKDKNSSTSLFSEPSEKEQTEDNKTEEESNPSPKSSSSVFQPEESEDTDEDVTDWTEKQDNSKNLFQEALIVQQSSLWECKQCTFINTGNNVKCEICGDINGRVRRSQRTTASHDSHLPSTFPAMDDGTIHRHGVMKKKVVVGKKQKDL